MLKKMTLLAMSVGALIAFAAPAAQGQQLYELEGATHVPLKVGAGVTATSTNLKTATKFGNLECKKVIIHGVVAENNATKSRITVAKEQVTVEECNSPIVAPGLTEITIEAGGVGLGTGAVFTSSATGCTFEGNIPFSYTTNTDVLTITGTEQFTGTPDPACGKGTMTGSFTLETSNGTAVLIT